MKNKKRLLALAMTASMAATMMVGCGSKTAGNGSGKGSEAASNGSAAGITIYNSKTEIQSQMEDIAKAYTKETGVPVEVTIQGTGSTVATDLSTAYASGNPYTISMVDAKDGRERNLPSEYSRHRFCFTRTGRFYLPEVTGRPLRK